MSRDEAIEHGSYEEFQGRIDVAFNKADPAASIPWGIAAPPWAAEFRPRRIVDLGSATAHFTVAVLQRLGGWGCLGSLEEVLLFEEEPGFDGRANGAGERDAADRCAAVLKAYDASQAFVSTINEPISLETGALFAAGEPVPAADLVIASHFSYYFPSSEAELLDAIASGLTAHGVAWLVIRRRASPIYRAREAELRRAADAIDDASYAEDLEQRLDLPGAPLSAMDARTLDYLLPAQRPADCIGLAHLLMWRRAPDPAGRPGELAAAQAACRSTEPLFSERHLVLAKASPA